MDSNSVKLPYSVTLITSSLKYGQSVLIGAIFNGCMISLA